MQVPSFRKKLKDCLICSQKNEESNVQSRSFDHFFEFVVNQYELFDVLRIADQSSTYLTDCPFDISWKKCNQPIMAV